MTENTNIMLLDFRTRDWTTILPLELLAHIFSFLAEVYPLNFDADLDLRLGWVTVTHTCRRWRTAALLTPTLWTRLSPAMGPAYDVFLKRSKGALLTIEGRIDTSDLLYDPMFLPSICQHRHRIQELSLSKLSPQSFAQLFNGLIDTLPNLVTMSILTCQYDFPVPRLPSAFLSHITPHLRELRLSAVDFPCEALPSSLPSLRTFLFDDGPPTAQRVATSFSDITLTLSKMPALRTLRLVMTLSESQLPIGAHLGEVVSWSDIEVLVIESRNDTAWYLWSCLRVPSSAHIHVRSTQLSAGVVTLMISTLQSHLALSPLPHFLGLFTHSVSRGVENMNFRLRGRHVERLGECEQKCSTRVQPSLELGLCTGSAEALWKRLLAVLPVKSIQELRVDVGSGINWDYEKVRELLLPLRSVTHLQTDSGVVYAALEPSSFPETKPKDISLFPALTKLRAVSSSPTTYIMFSRISAQVKDALRRTLEHRNSLGSGHLELVLRRNRGWEEHVDQWRFREVVEWVERAE
ncbi:unnamed protein product [Peniophora sp. CBMAI 1063]|nr:unnamed protein product [Peniophora sp. CBMAI 1063]